MITRFAPSPTGPLHLGHAFSALTAWDMAQAAGGTFLLRIDDLDRSRARPEWETRTKDDLRWLGLSWPEPCRRESEHLSEYAAALDRLWTMGLLYPCTCTRRDIRDALSAPQEGAPLMGPDGLIYPGTCRPARPPSGPRPDAATLRLDMARACAVAGAPGFTETATGTQTVQTPPDRMVSRIGDVALARRDMGAAYHLAVVVDDAAQRITHVVRGADLFEATPIHALLQRLLGLPTPVYHHHRLIRDDAGKRLAKRDDARAIALYRTEGRCPDGIRAMVGLRPSAP
ncbi:tRNA glutamyl-Q(34) synthetase GluQRS [Salipiger aestuarii]|uniref:Glutamyl-Q tRNA(Asp) synthetase n=1 Tax=Salipiger aestuarii TaxID=568098 RepID=A0A327XUI7_9RHOB|nr:tRNA glutamyl-Q(34) synthetase GluQRS [Salipiger aestuarii]EIE48976.1 glutamyl-tRNA synthetase, class Ic [Citreicella sp. 357]KAA8608797.1 glutamyl-tRNA synthetase [Salipiger aestuarii]KAB2540747.1 glutamyl-tRNA synthetase [Salipiger aestuarii]RAK11962.1 glutamyl-Q tRNA(Asp) synthetase [Salipiger aestuarii]